MANITLATKAKQVEAWLAALPHGDPLARARQLAGYLAAHDSHAVASSFRRQLYDLVSIDLRRVLNTLEVEFRDMPLPMDARQLDHVDHALGLLVAAADFNKHLALDSSGRSPPLFGENPLPGHLGRFLQVQREIMDLCHLSHRQLPAGYWLDTHQAGQLLVASGLLGAPDPARPAGSLGEIYLAVLLEAAADPYHFSEQERGWALDIIGRYGNQAQVEPAQGASPAAVFGIRAHEDKPPYPLSWQGGTTPDCDLVLNTAPLVRKLAWIISQLDRSEAIPKAVPVIQQPGYRDLLQRLKQTWGGSSQRTTARHRPARPSQRTVVLGFYPVYHHLAGAAGQADASATVHCQMVNESLGGMALMVVKPAFRLKIGSLVCVGRGEDCEDLGLVRWFKTGANGALTFGIKYLYGRMRPGIWNLPGDGRGYPGLLADPEKGQPRIVRSLITPALRIDPTATLEMVQGDVRTSVRLAGKIEALPEIDIFRCAHGLD